MTGEKATNSDPRHTFEAFVVGPANRLASAAARRAAESPGTSFNPLFLYAASGLGKSHILSAIANLSARVHPEHSVAYLTLEGYLDELLQSLEKGGQGSMRDRYADLHVLLLDDVQFLTGQPQAQEMLLRTLDALTGRGAQVVLASDRPPAEINDLDARLLSRFSGGLIVDMGSPDYETRVAILRRKAEERGSALGEGVAEAMARFPFRNVRELQGALNRVLAVQDMEERPVMPKEIPPLLGVSDADGEESAPPEGPIPDPEAEEEPLWRVELRAAIRSAEAGGFEAQRILRLLEEEDEPENWTDVLEAFRSGVRRAQEIRAELAALGNPWPEAAETLLRDPERVDQAEHLLASARERARPFGSLPEGPELSSLGASFPALAISAAQRLLKDERLDYSPLYLHSGESGRAREFLEAVGRSYVSAQPNARVGFTSVQEFSQDFIRAISEGVAGAWRERWWSVEVLLLHGIEEISSMERAQEEFFHLFEALKRRTARIFLGSDRPPGAIDGVEERLSSRFEGGLVLDLGPSGANAVPAPQGIEEVDSGAGSRQNGGRGGEVVADAVATEWYPSRERVVWDWPSSEERIVSEEE